MKQISFPFCPVCGAWIGHGNRTVNYKYCTPKCERMARPTKQKKVNKSEYPDIETELEAQQLQIEWLRHRTVRTPTPGVDL